MKEKRNSVFDLVWILPAIIGELFIVVYIPIRLTNELSIVGIFNITGLLYLAVIYLLLFNIRLTGLRELFKISWKTKKNCGGGKR